MHCVQQVLRVEENIVPLGEIWQEGIIYALILPALKLYDFSGYWVTILMWHPSPAHMCSKLLLSLQSYILYRIMTKYSLVTPTKTFFLFKIRLNVKPDSLPFLLALYCHTCSPQGFSLLSNSTMKVFEPQVNSYRSIDNILSSLFVLDGAKVFTIKVFLVDSWHKFTLLPYLRHSLPVINI